MTNPTKRIAMIVKNNFEQAEMKETRQFLEEKGIQVDLIGIKEREVQGLNHIEKAEVFSVDKLLSDITPNDYDALVLPGGAVNADELRVSKPARDFVTAMYKTEKPIAAICHAPWLLVSAGIAKGHTMTSFPSIQDDIRNAGAKWVDQTVHIDGNIITSRNPADIPAFSRAIVHALGIAS